MAGLIAPVGATRGGAALPGGRRFTAAVADACHILLDSVLRFADVERALVVVRVDDTLRGYGFGVQDDQLQQLLGSRGHDTQQLVDALDRGTPAHLDEEAGLSFLGFRSATVVPFPGARGIPAGAVILDGAISDAVLQRVRETTNEVGPTVARIVEVDELRARMARHERDISLLDALVHSF